MILSDFENFESNIKGFAINIYKMYKFCKPARK